MIREKLIVSGQVAEGGIRYFAQMKASGLSLTGLLKEEQKGQFYLKFKERKTI